MNMIGLISMAPLRTGARRAGDQTDDLIHVCSLNYRQAGKRRLPGKGRTGGRTTGRLRRNGVIAHEEAYLEREFGDDYCHFRTAVRRWL
jgi:hypothetical protein